VDCNTESQDESGGALLHALVTKNKNQTYQLRNEAQLNCVALRSSLDYEMAGRSVKGQDKRPKTAPLTDLPAIGAWPRRWRKK
jgi:hypothetical protein